MILIKAPLNEVDIDFCKALFDQIKATYPEQVVLFIPDNVYIKEHCTMDDLLDIEKLVSEAKERLIEEEQKGDING